METQRTEASFSLTHCLGFIIYLPSSVAQCVASRKSYPSATQQQGSGNILCFSYETDTERVAELYSYMYFMTVISVHFLGGNFLEGHFNFHFMT